MSQILATPKKALGDTHSVILRLSRDSSRRPRLVTTNFDRLFERVDRKVPIHVAPILRTLRRAAALRASSTYTDDEHYDDARVPIAWCSRVQTSGAHILPTAGRRDS